MTKEKKVKGQKLMQWGGKSECPTCGAVGEQIISFFGSIGYMHKTKKELDKCGEAQ